MKKIICVGSSTRDIFLGVNIDDKEPQKICLEAGQKIYTDSFRETVGGGAVNVGAGLRKLGFRAFVFARTDKSFTGKWIQKQIGKLKLKKNYLQQTGKVPSETSVIIADKQEGDRVILRSGDSVENFNLVKACQRFREKVDWIYLSSQKKNHLENMDVLFEFVREKKAKLAFNPSSYQIANNADEVLLKLSSVDILFVNLEEAVGLLKENIKDYRSEEGDVQKEKMTELFDKLLNFKVTTVVITDGANGAWLGELVSNEMFVYHLPAEKVEKIVDTTGAGNAFVAGFLAVYVNDENELETSREEKLQRALAGGLANSSGVISEVGATNGLLKFSTLKRKIKKMV